MTTFVILAAGRGTRIGRVGESLHKALVPLNQKAVLTHLLDLAPPNARVIICLGHRADQIKEYVGLAHPNRPVEFVHVAGWDKPGGGPGASLLAAKVLITDDDDLVFTSCDTLWEDDPGIWRTGSSWVGVAAVPAGTPPERWCRIAHDDEYNVNRIMDKTDEEPRGLAYTGLARIAAEDLSDFWAGVMTGDLLSNERQVTGGLRAICPKLKAWHIHWTDVGDEAAYARAIAEVSGYDWTKVDEATYVLPDDGRVVKFWADETIPASRIIRGSALGEAVPPIVGIGRQMLAYGHAAGQTGYTSADRQEEPGGVMREVIEWAMQLLWEPVDVTPTTARTAALEFYEGKTMQRIGLLPSLLRRHCTDALGRIDWNELADGVQPAVFHGDFNLGNIIDIGGGVFLGIDWRQDFAGHVAWGDQRYDIAKLLAGTVVHWDNARRGDFRPWDRGPANADAIRNWLVTQRKDIEIIGALSLLSSAPLHASPLDEILVARGLHWLEEFT